MTSMMKVSEKDIAAAVRKYLEQGHGLTVRSEVPVTLPDVGRVTADLVAMQACETGDQFTVVECKRRLDSEVESQAMRWVGHCDYLCVAYLNQASAVKNRNRMDRLDRCGIGRLAFSDQVGLIVQTNPHWLAPSDTRLIAAAFHSHDGSLDPDAGVAAAKRMTPNRTRWEAIRQYIHCQTAGTGVKGIPGKDIRMFVHGERRTTDAQLRSAIDRQELLGVVYFDRDGITQYRAGSESVSL